MDLNRKKGSADGLLRQFKEIGADANGEAIYAEVMALEADSIGSGGSGGGGLTDVQLRATPVPVSGTFWQATQPVSGPLTDAQLRAAPVPVSGPATDTQMRATPLGVYAQGTSASGAADNGLPVKVGGRYNTTPPTFTDGQRGDVQLNSRGSLTIGLGAGGGVGDATQVGILLDQSGVSRGLATGLLGYNGASWDRLRSDITNGLDVDVTRVQGSVAVTGTFWQTTQPVSGTVSISGVVDVTPAAPAAGDYLPVRLTDGTSFYIAGGGSGSGGLTDTELRATPVPISGSVIADATGSEVSVVNAVGVTGTFWQATQPVSGTVAISNFPASQAVTGTFWQATQPISGTVAATQSGVWTVQPGNTPNTTPWLVKDTRDNLPQNVMIGWDEMAGTAAAESALTNATFRTENMVALVAASSYTVPAGKRLRITEIHCYVKATSTVNNLARLRLRAHATTVANTSPPVFSAILSLGAPGTVAANLMEHAEFSFPEASLDFAAGNQIAFQWNTAAATCTVGMTVVGYLYTP